MLNLLDETYDYIKEEMMQVIRRHLKKNYDSELVDIKLLVRSQDSLELVALDTMYSLWKFTLSFRMTGEFPVHPLQSAVIFDSKSVENIFLVKKNRLKKLGISDKLIASHAISFFESVQSFKDKEEAEKSAEKLAQNAILKEKFQKSSL